MAQTGSPQRSARLDVRLTRAHKRMIERAADATGQSVSDFAVTNLVQAARRTIDDASTTRLTDRDRDTFLRLVAADARPNRALAAAAARYKKRRA